METLNKPIALIIRRSGGNQITVHPKPIEKLSQNFPVWRDTRPNAQPGIEMNILNTY
ncbi:hypothetical protein C8R27_102122 [Nitrosomonas ureae]|uniref:Uncharacterized protein n=1 Tax=Nitrosomonas ureae TaxID=44577 RepID=A0A2T5IQN8_9PROT|nr:hypothetical protein C8R28_101157 [Nitrosomonas ureae]PXX17882.1 hypothetical protein C8R27_102122 [Nitrosomonas ureae]